MDLLDSILKSMDAPPTCNEQQKQRELVERIKLNQREELDRFRGYVQERMGRFANDERASIEFQPLDRMHRTIVHDMAQHGGFIAMSFGRGEDIRQPVIYKKDQPPDADELAARRKGDGWNLEVAKFYAQRRKERGKDKAKDIKAQQPAKPSPAVLARPKPIASYKTKYAHLIGEPASLQAVRETATNHSYGFVPSKLKRDHRSIEQTLADIQARKRLKLQQEQEEEEEELMEEEQSESEASASESESGLEDVEEEEEEEGEQQEEEEQPFLGAELNLSEEDDDTDSDEGQERQQLSQWPRRNEQTAEELSETESEYEEDEEEEQVTYSN